MSVVLTGIQTINDYNSLSAVANVTSLFSEQANRTISRCLRLSVYLAIIGQIASSAAEQSQVAGDINQNIVRIRDLATHNLNTLREVDASTVEFQQAFEQIESQVGRYRID